MTAKKKMELDALDHAIRVLSNTNRGRQVMGDMLIMLENGGISLDCHGQSAAFQILKSVWGNLPGTTLDLLKEACE